MADAPPLVFNLALGADRDRFVRLYRCDGGEPLSAIYWRLFEEVASAWRLDADVLSWYRRRLVVVLNRLEARCIELGGPLEALRNPATILHLQAAQRIVEDARNAYALQVGQSIIRGRALGGRAKDRPDWWDPMIQHATLLLAMGHGARDVVGICARSSSHSESAIRRMLQHEGVLAKRKPSAK